MKRARSSLPPQWNPSQKRPNRLRTAQMFELSDYLKERRVRIDARLRQLIEGAEIASERLKEAMGYSLFAGGKRLRPAVLLASHEIFSPLGPYALDAACALELLHTYSLIHDDLPSFDDDDLRRGRPTSHVVFGEWMAILAGDALNTLAFEVLAGGSDDVPPEWKLEAIVLVAAAAGAPGMVGGQALDMSMQGRAAAEAEIREMQQLKTGAMLRVAAETGALLAGAGEAERDSLRRYGELTGLAFQIRDDLLDIGGSAEELGKSPGKDGAAGKSTLPAQLGEAAAAAEAERLVSLAVKELEGFGEAAEPLRAIARYSIARRS
ncbi:MAG TPA: farnesyl diphosphate synthase [Acidobacteriota bacterium]|nr:farnesyl diphosphate synthase [Acidobacteriota bacterium]